MCKIVIVDQDQTKNKDLVYKKLDKILKIYKKPEIYVVDNYQENIGIIYAKERNIPWQVFYSKSEIYGRNAEIVQYARMMGYTNAMVIISENDYKALTKTIVSIAKDKKIDVYKIKTS